MNEQEYAYENDATLDSRRGVGGDGFGGITALPHLFFVLIKKTQWGGRPRKGTAAPHIKNRVKNEGGGFHHPKKHALSCYLRAVRPL